MEVKSKEFLQNYIELKNKELTKKLSSVIKDKKMRDEYILTKSEIENKIFELRNSSNFSYEYLEALEDALLVYDRDIDRLTLDISTEEQLIEDIRFDLEMTQNELFELIEEE